MYQPLQELIQPKINPQHSTLLKEHTVSQLQRSTS